MFRSAPFRGLVHLNLSLTLQHAYNYQPIGFLSEVAPQLRSLILNIKHSLQLSSDFDKPYYLDHSLGIGQEILKIAHNGILEVWGIAG